MAGDGLLRHFFGGLSRLHILHHAALAPVYGVEMIEGLGRHGYQLRSGTLSPALPSRAEGGYLTSEDDVVEGNRCSDHRATGKGAKRLHEAREKLRVLFRAGVEGERPA